MNKDLQSLASSGDCKCCRNGWDKIWNSQGGPFSAGLTLAGWRSGADGSSPSSHMCRALPGIPCAFRVTWELCLGPYSETATPVWQHKTCVVLHQQTSKKSFYLIVVKDALRRRKWVLCLVGQIEYHMQNRLLYNNEYLRKVWVIQTCCHRAKQGWDMVKKKSSKGSWNTFILHSLLPE